MCGIRSSAQNAQNVRHTQQRAKYAKCTKYAAIDLAGQSTLLTPRFSPGDHFGADVRMCDIVDSPLLRTVVARKRNISNPLAALFFEESKLLL